MTTSPLSSSQQETGLRMENMSLNLYLWKKTDVAGSAFLETALMLFLLADCNWIMSGALLMLCSCRQQLYVVQSSYRLQLAISFCHILVYSGQT